MAKAKPTRKPTLDDVMNKLGAIQKELKKAAIRDLQIAWLTFTAVGAGFIGASGVDIQHNWPGALVGLTMVTIGYCGVRFRWFARRKQ